MKSELAEEILTLVETRSSCQPALIEFEMAYQARVAVDRIKFAIKHTEEFGPRMEQMREVGLQLLDALQRLEAVDRRFQQRSLVAREGRASNRNVREASGKEIRPSHPRDGHQNGR